MQRSFLLFVCVCCLLTCSMGQKYPAQLYGTVPIDKVSFMDATEVTIYEWIHFIINNDFNDELFPEPSAISLSARQLFEDLKKQKDHEFIKIIDNKKQMRENYGSKGFIVTRKFNDLIVADTNYFSINIPITGISFMQANRFCKWREEVVNENREIKVLITLPSIALYEKVIENKDSINAKNCYLQNSLNCNCITVRKTKDYRSQGKCLMRADSYWPSPLGLYCLQGNASEMTSTNGIAMGGSFRDYARQSRSDQKQPYSKPEDWLGFRCFITLK